MQLILDSRAVIKDYLEILDLTRQNQIKDCRYNLRKVCKDPMPVVKDEANKDDDIEVL